MTASFTDLCEALLARTPSSRLLSLAAVQHQSFASSQRGIRSVADPEERVRLRAEAASRFFMDDALPGCVSTAPACAVLWEMAQGSTENLLRATILGNEIGVRVGVGLAASPGDQRPSAAAAVAAALALSGASPEKLAMGVANAVNGAPVQSMGEWAAKPGQGLAAVAGWRARAGSEGRFSLPEWALDPEPELMGMLAIKTLAGPAFAQVALEAVAEVLARHVKAADKRLRADQVERIELKLAYPAWRAQKEAKGTGAPVDIKSAIGTLVAHYALDASVLSSGAKQEEAALVASKVEVMHDWRLSFVAAPSRLGMLQNRRDLLKIAQEMGAPGLEVGAALPSVGPALLALGEKHKLAKMLGREDPVELKLYTTRGGWWPERRSRPAGRGEAAEKAALKRLGREVPLLTDARDWIRELSA